MSPPTLALEARGLVKRYDDTTALGGVTLAVPTGTVTAVALSVRLYQRSISK